jgi:hypothetical protein
MVEMESWTLKMATIRLPSDGKPDLAFMERRIYIKALPYSASL